MARLLLAFLGVWLAGATVINTPVKSYTINLTAPPTGRWDEVVDAHVTSIVDLIVGIKQTLPKKTLSIVEFLAADLDTYFHSYAEEIRGVYKAVNKKVASISLADIVMMQTLYDFTAFGCTSIVAEDMDGNIWHARNLDYHVGTSLLRNITVAVHFQERGKTVYSGVTFAGYVGLLTGLQPHGYTISLDERDQGPLSLNYEDFKHEGTAVNFWALLVRDTIANHSLGFDGALRHLANAPTIAPCYVIVGGVGRGNAAIITRGRLNSVDWWDVNVDAGRWWILETNYDHWVPPPKSDDRRDPANLHMSQIGQKNISLQAMWSKVLSIPPVLNDGTVYTALMSAAFPDKFHVEVRDYKP